jgi:hypothetical protein
MRIWYALSVITILHSIAVEAANFNYQRIVRDTTGRLGWKFEDFEKGLHVQRRSPNPNPCGIECSPACAPACTPGCCSPPPPPPPPSRNGRPTWSSWRNRTSRHARSDGSTWASRTNKTPSPLVSPNLLSLGPNGHICTKLTIHVPKSVLRTTRLLQCWTDVERRVAHGPSAKLALTTAPSHASPTNQPAGPHASRLNATCVAVYGLHVYAHVYRGHLQHTHSNMSACSRL